MYEDEEDVIIPTSKADFFGARNNKKKKPDNDSDKFDRKSNKTKVDRFNKGNFKKNWSVNF